MNYKHIKSGLAIVYARLRNDYRIRRIDTFKSTGILADIGFHQFTSECKFIENPRLNELIRSNDEIIELLEIDTDRVIDILKIVKPLLDSYFNKNWEVTNAFYSNMKHTEGSISDKWHTDGCGKQIKIFYCEYIEKEMNTKIVSQQSGFTYFDKLRIEIPRWFGKGNHINEKHESTIRHTPGSLSLFSTDLLHRGDYSVRGSRRISLEIHINIPGKIQVITSDYLKPWRSESFVSNRTLQTAISMINIK